MSGADGEIDPGALLSPHHATTAQRNLARCALFALAVTNGRVLAATIIVPDDFPTVGAAMVAAVDGDEVLIMPGTYSNEGELSFEGKKIRVRGTAPSDTSVVDATVVEPTTFGFTAGEDTNSVLSGLTVRGGGIWVSDGAWPLVEHCALEAGEGVDVWGGGLELRDCRIRRNDTDYVGGGCFFYQAQATILRCQIDGNSAPEWAGGVGAAESSLIIRDSSISNNETWYEFDQGGGIRATSSQLVLIGTRIDGNSAHGEESYGGGVYLGNDSNATFIACTLQHNRALVRGGAISAGSGQIYMSGCRIGRNWAGTSGGGIHANGIGARFESCMFMDNQAEDALVWNGGDLLISNCTFIDDVVRVNGLNAHVRNCILWGEDNPLRHSGQTISVRFSDVQGGWPGEGNIDLDPLFFARGPANGLLRAGSPCVDSGSPRILDAVFDSHPRWPDALPNGERSDMGAYGGPDNGNWLYYARLLNDGR